MKTYPHLLLHAHMGNRNTHTQCCCFMRECAYVHALMSHMTTHTHTQLGVHHPPGNIRAAAIGVVRSATRDLYLSVCYRGEVWMSVYMCASVCVCVFTQDGTGKTELANFPR